jgi:hypothetical protein
VVKFTPMDSHPYHPIQFLPSLGMVPAGRFGARENAGTVSGDFCVL